MKKEKLAIVSSYDDFCGNASYTRALANGLSKDFDVTVLSLNVELLRKGDNKAANLHIEKLCKQLRDFDCVNIQFEAGLFGTDPSKILKRFFSLAKACKKLTLTMHRYHGKEKYPNFISLGKTLLKGRLRDFLKAIKTAKANNRLLPLYNSIIHYCKKKQFPILLHTQRDCELIITKFNYNRVFHHPLCFYDQNYYKTIKDSFTRQDFCKSYGLDEKKTYIGIFGFISENKGHRSLIQTLRYLPTNYELLIFGAQHPHSIQLDEPINKYLEKLLSLIGELQLTNRVKFIHAFNDDEFIKAMIGCDFNVLPYLEVNQGGSGIAALSLETHSKTIFSQNYAFFELGRYARNCFKMFSIGNYLELAHAIQSYRHEDYVKNLQNYNNTYNIHSSVELYKNILTMA